MFLKLLLLGAARVGKSSLLSRFCASRSFDSGYHETLSPDFGGTRVRLQSGVEAVLQIWDLPGNPAALSALPRPAQEHWKDTHVCILVCDLCSKESFTCLERLRAEFLAAESRNAASLSFVLLINKAEPTHARKQAVFASDVLAWCSKHNIRHFYETSALADTNVLLALVNITQLAADMDMIRRGIKVACDAQELARQEEREAREAAEAAAAAAAAEAARVAAAEAAAEAIRRAEQEKIDAALKREKDFEARWEAQRQEAAEAAAKAEAERAAVAARVKERSDRRKANIAVNAYGPYKQRAHRLSAALIQQHAQAAADAFEGTGLVDLSAMPALGQVYPVPSGAEPESAPLHKPGALPASLRAPSKIVQKRPSALGKGAGAMLKQSLQALDGVPERSSSATPSSGAVPASAAADGRNSARRPSTSMSTSTHSSALQLSVTEEDSEHPRSQGPLTVPATLRAHPPSHQHPPHSGGSSARVRRTNNHARGESFGGTQQHVLASFDEKEGSEPAEADGDADAEVSAAAEAAKAFAAAEALADADDAALLAQPVDPVTEALFDIVLAQVSFSLAELLRLYAPFDGAPPDGLAWGSWKRMWLGLSSRVPAWGLFGERIFAAMDHASRGRVDFESFALGLNALSGTNVDARAKLLFRVFDYAHVPFVPVPRREAEEQNAGAEGHQTAAEQGEEKSDTTAKPPQTTSAQQQPQQAPLTKKSFAQRQRRELQGLEHFPYIMYDSATDVSAAPDSSSAAPSSVSSLPGPHTRPADRFITRDCVVKVCTQLMHSLPACQALLQSAPPVAVAGGVDSHAQVSSTLHSVVTRLVDAWFGAVGHPLGFALSELQWRHAVLRQPDIIQPFAPPLHVEAIRKD